MGIKERWNRYAPLPDDILERLDGLSPFFAEKEVALAYIFGSLAKGKGNDVDLAILYAGDFPAMREELQERLATWRLDIINLETASASLAFEIISTGRLLYRADAEAENSFEMRVIKQYQDRKPLRDRQLAHLKENMGLALSA
ncbi:MAG: nucleotidyltransferase domain-containing protein [Nitrospirales bacterium]|nr:nucleotidyltransferase domain-containing protein [Nitrospirales bacterium]